MTLTSFFDQPDHPECEFCVPLGSIKPHEELDKNFLSHLTEITLHGNFDFLKVNETKIQKNRFPKVNGIKMVKNEKIYRSRSRL